LGPLPIKRTQAMTTGGFFISRRSVTVPRSCSAARRFLASRKPAFKAVNLLGNTE
jgi:hypothetical protein